jgi:hypothetical protein
MCKHCFGVQLLPNPPLCSSTLFSPSSILCMASVPDGTMRHGDERKDAEMHRYVQALFWSAVVAACTVNIM